MMYLGTLGRMVEIKCPTTQRVAPAERFSFSTTLGGEVKAQMGPLGRRTWDIQLGRLSTPSDVEALMAFANGDWGAGPFWFIPADAPVVNLMPPAVAASDPAFISGTAAGPWLTSEGWAARSTLNDTGGFIYWRVEVPVLQGVEVTGSMVVRGDGGQVRLNWLDALGNSVGISASERVAGSETQRIAVTAAPPIGAVSARLGVSPLVERFTRPSMTWTTEPYEFGDGQGCSKAVVLNASRDVTTAWNDPRTGRWSDISFAVQEVG